MPFFRIALKKLAFFVFSNRLRISIRLKKLNSRNLITVVNLHKISSTDNSTYRPMTVQLFEELITFLTANFSFTSFYNLRNKIHIKTLDKPMVIISFDDGYYDFLENALPILKRNNVRANLNIIPYCVETGKPPLNVLIQDYLGKSKEFDTKLFKILKLTKEAGFRNRVELGTIISAWVKARSFKGLISLRNRIDRIIGKDFYQFSSKMLSLSNLKEIESYCDLGAHSFYHSNMSVESKKFVTQDMIECKKWFKKKLNKEVDIFAFPNNSYKKEQVDLALELGYAYILSVNNTVVDRSTNFYDRIGIDATSKAEAIFKVLGGLKKI